MAPGPGRLPPFIPAATAAGTAKAGAAKRSAPRPYRPGAARSRGAGGPLQWTMRR